MEIRDRVISLFYEAAINPSLWPVALDSFAEATHTTGAHLFVFNKASKTPVIGYIAGRFLDPGLIGPYVGHYKRLDPLLPAVLDGPRSEKAMLCHELVAQHTVRGSEYYQDFLIPSRGRYMAGWNLEKSRDRVTVLGLHKRRTRFERHELDPWEGVALHARRAVELSINLLPRLARGDLLRNVIDQQGIVCFMVGSDARILDYSAAACRMIESGGPLSLRFAGQLATKSAEETRQLHRLIHQAASGHGAGSMRLAGNSRNQATILQVVPSGIAQENPFNRNFAGCALVFVNLPRQPVRLDANNIRLTINCTLAEANVAADLASGMNPAEIAAKRRVSIHTIRSQIRALLEKTGLHRVAHLVSRLTTIC